ncbi:hypothetical protein F511_40416 [Dorcoceras hygrometricum]|uniref:Uncharacterized protein n=1 Tax=Dorcoceras hygrometricum TaxID=472368 RepID=A0A2Z7B9B3_9LAMI|nr:hypothetical protein F511_40416 [Dorcoceras hygrometricum]
MTCMSWERVPVRRRLVKSHVCSDVVSRFGVVLIFELVPDVNLEVVGGCCSPDLTLRPLCSPTLRNISRSQICVARDFVVVIVAQKIELSYAHTPRGHQCSVDLLSFVEQSLRSFGSLSSVVALFSCIAFAFYLLLFTAVFQLLSVLGFDPMSPWGWCLFACVCCPGFPGYSAGRGVDPAGGAPGGG